MSQSSEQCSCFALWKSYIQFWEEETFILGFSVSSPFPQINVGCVWNLMAHSDAREGKWRGDWRMEWVASTLTLPRNVVYPALPPLMRIPRLPAFYRTDAPADLNGLFRFGERRNLVSVLVPSRFKRSVPQFSQGVFPSTWSFQFIIHPSIDTNSSEVKSWSLLGCNIASTGESLPVDTVLFNREPESSMPL